MTLLVERSPLVLALALYALTLADVSSGFTLIPLGGAIALGVLSLFGLLLATNTLRLDRNPSSLVLVAASLLALMFRLGGLETAAHRPLPEWESYRRQLREDIADKASAQFTSLCLRARLSARRLSREPALVQAAAEPDLREGLAAAFDVLQGVSLPLPVREAVVGATLYDEWNTPLAWARRGVDLEPYFELQVGEIESRTFILKQGVFTYLVILEPLSGDAGAVTLEIPLAARRRLENRYQTDYEVVTAWAGKQIATDYVDVREEAPELARLFERSGDRYWGGTRESPVLYFPLRSSTGDLLGVSSLVAEDPATVIVETRRETQRVAGISLALAALTIVVLLATKLWRSAGRDRQPLRRTLARAAFFGAALWGLRIVLILVDIPLGFSTGADNPVHYASSSFFDFFRSPADFLATALVIATSIGALAFPSLSATGSTDKNPPHPVIALLLRSLACACALLVLVTTNAVIEDTWLNSNLPLALPGLLPPDPPRLAVQWGLLLLFVTAGVVSVLLFSVAARLSRTKESVSLRSVSQHIILDVVIFAIGYVVLSTSFESAARWFAPCLIPLLVFDLCALTDAGFVERLVRGGFYVRFAVAILVILLPALSFYPAVVYFGDRATRQFIESTVSPGVVHHDDSQLYVLRETVDAVDQMELSGRLGEPDRDDVAFQVWSGSDLSVAAFSSSVEVYDEEEILVSRFALNFPSAELAWREPTGPAPKEWSIVEERDPGQPSRPVTLHARRAVRGFDGSLWDFRIRLVADWGNLPFIATRNPYIDLFRSAGAETPLPLPNRELTLHVLDLDGNVVFRSSDTELSAGPGDIARARQGPHWVDRYTNQGHWHVLFFTDSEYVFALSYPAKLLLAYAAEVTGWAIFAALTAALFPLIMLLVAAAGGPVLFRPRDIWAEVGKSFYGKLFAAFVLLALIPTVSLAVLARGVIVQHLEREVEQEGLGKARVVERFVRDYLLFERIDASDRGTTAVTDALLEWVGSLVDADVDLYSRGELVATSKRELFASGLLPTRAVPAVYREVVLNRANQSIHRESVGAFQYLVVSVPISFERRLEADILSIPLASRQHEINLQFVSLNQTLLLAAICFTLVAAALAFSLARRIAEPINTLTAATRRVAQGDFEVSLRAQSRDEIGALSRSFNRMTSDLKRQRKDLERTKKLEAWAEMARQVAHEVKNPLTPIQLSTEHMLRVFGDKGVNFGKVLKDCTETILQQVRALRQISMEFSAFATPFPLQREATDLGRLVETTVEPYRQAPPPGVTVSIELAPALPRLQLDRRRIQRTLVNLIENAFSALDGDGKVTVSVRPVRVEDRDWIELSVADTGVGVEPEVREHIFEPYFSTRAGGTGLGLAIARKAVEEHGGTISLESEAGRGTRVFLRLPVGD